MWESHESFEGMLEEAWKAMPACTSVKDMTSKLSAVASALKRWDAESFGSIRQEMRKLR